VARIALEIPKVGLVMENARLVRWLKHVGDRVQQGEPLLELETEKSVVEIEATESGRLLEILLHPEQEARVGDTVAWLETDAPAPSVAPQTPQALQTPQQAQPPQAPQHAQPPQQAPPPAHAAANRIRSSPVARRLATQHTIDLRQVTGTGPRGRIQLNDVRRAIESQSARGGSAAARAGPQPLSSMRRALARSMTLSNATVPQFMVERAVDWTSVHAERARLASELPAGFTRPSVNDFLLHAIARTLLSFPALNAIFRGDPNSPDASIVPASGAHIGLVVAVENGLLVPVLHGVDKLSLPELARRRSETVERALHGKLRRDELEGATFSLSNLGSRGPDRFNAIINPPESAILAVGRQRDSVVAINREIHVRPLSHLTLTVDHRVADGRLASDFLAYLVDILESGSGRPKEGEDS
jgi:pyruvate dehydrogenase E2 component (dihydrolipoamide acetyltransferase)